MLVDGDQQGLLPGCQVLVGKGLREQRLGPEVGPPQQVRRHLGQIEVPQGAGRGRTAGGRTGGGHRAFHGIGLAIVGTGGRRRKTLAPGPASARLRAARRRRRGSARLGQNPALTSPDAPPKIVNIVRIRILLAVPATPARPVPRNSDHDDPPATQLHRRPFRRRRLDLRQAQPGRSRADRPGPRGQPRAGRPRRRRRKARLAGLGRPAGGRAHRSAAGAGRRHHPPL